MPSPTEVRAGIDPMVDNILVGYRSNQYIGLEIFPVHPIAKDSETVPIFGKDLLRDFDTEWTPGAHVKEFDYTMTHAHVAKHYHNATVPVPDSIPGNWQIPTVTAQSFAAQLAMDIILRKHEIHCAAIAMAAGSYAGGHSENAAAAWAPAAFGLIAEIYTHKLTVATAIGVEPNVFWCGADVWATIQQNTGMQTAAALARGYTTGVAMPPSMMTQDTVAAIIGAEKVVVGKHLTCGDTTTVFAYTWADTAGWAYIPPGGISMSAPFGNTFREPGYPNAKMWYSDDVQSWKFAAFDRMGVQVMPITHGGTTTESGYVWTNCI